MKYFVLLEHPLDRALTKDKQAIMDLLFTNAGVFSDLPEAKGGIKQLFYDPGLLLTRDETDLKTKKALWQTDAFYCIAEIEKPETGYPVPLDMHTVTLKKLHLSPAKDFSGHITDVVEF